MEQEELSRRPISTDGQEPGDDCLAGVIIKSFKAQPNHLYPGQTTTLSWECELPEHCNVGLFMDRMPIERIGSKVVTVTVTRTFNIQAKALGRFSTFFPGVTVTVDDNGCFIFPIPESLIKPEILSKLTEKLQQDGRFYYLQPISVEVISGGIELKIASKLAIDGYNPNMRMRIVLRPMIFNGDLRVIIDVFDVSLNWPWWYEITIEEYYSIREQVRSGLFGSFAIPLADAAKTLFDNLIAQYLNMNQLIAAITIEEDVINVKICRRQMVNN